MGAGVLGTPACKNPRQRLAALQGPHRMPGVAGYCACALADDPLDLPFTHN